MKVTFLFTENVCSDQLHGLEITIFFFFLDIRADASVLLHEACEALGSKGSTAGLFNSLPWDRQEVIEIKDGTDGPDLGVENINYSYSDAC